MGEGGGGGQLVVAAWIEPLFGCPVLEGQYYAGPDDPYHSLRLNFSFLVMYLSHSLHQHWEHVTRK